MNPAIPRGSRSAQLRPPLAMITLSVLLIALCGAWTPARAQEAAIRKNLPERLPNLPKIEEVTRSPIPGIWEVRIGSELIYTDDQGQFIITGDLIDTRTRVNMSKERLDKLSAFDFPKLPLKDAIAIKQGNGSRKLAVFVDPNCGYCKRFERDIAGLKNVTIYTFLYPILGPDSLVKSRDIWCAKDPARAWRDWMLSGALPPSSAGSRCDTTALERNTELGRQHRVQGTPAAVFEDGSRAPGAVSADEVEKRLSAASGKG